MPSSYLIFDFGEDEEAAQQARHKVEGWKQGFRLGDKLAIKFEREHPDAEASESAEEDAEGSGARKESSNSSAKPAPGKPASAAKDHAAGRLREEKVIRKEQGVFRSGRRAKRRRKGSSDRPVKLLGP
jgi:hypothetical protein